MPGVQAQYSIILVKLTLIAVALAETSSAIAQSPGAEETLEAPWRLGVIGTYSDEGYVDEDTSASAFPLIDIDSRWLFFRGDEGGVHLYRNNGFRLDAIVSIGGQELEADDLGRSALAARDVDRDRLEDRDRSYYAGLSGAWSSRFGVLSAQAISDISDHADGEIYRAGYAYPWQAGSLQVVPNVRLTYLSDNVVGYYYGLDAGESLSGTYSYSPDAALIPSVGLDVTYPLTRRWSVLAGAEYRDYPDEISDSPLIEEDYGTAFRLGVAYSF